MAELLGTYYNKKLNLDFRCLRYPGVVSALPPGGGTTDFIIDMYYAAVNGEECVSFLHENTELPMIHLDDCIEGTVRIITHSLIHFRADRLNGSRLPEAFSACV